MKRLLLSALSILMVSLAAISATADTYWLSLCNGESASKSDLTFDGDAEISVATLFDASRMEPFRGCQAVSLRIGIVSRLKLEGLEVWISRSLDQAPSASAVISKADLKSGWNEVLLDAPLEITGEDLYVGYTFRQPSRCNVVSLVPAVGSYSLYTDSGQGWEENEAGVGKALSIELGVEGESISRHDLSISGFEPLYRELESGSTAYYKVEVVNTGVETAEQVEYLLDSGTGEESGSCPLPSLEPRQKAEFYIKGQLDQSGGEQTAVLKLLSVNGQKMTSPKEARACVTVSEAPLLRRRVLLEEFSNEYCGNCPAASDKIHEVIASLEDPTSVDLVVHHAGSGYDLFTVEASKAYESFYHKGKYSPMMTADRTPYGGWLDMVPSENSEIKTRIESALRVPAGSSLWIEPSIDTEKGIVEVVAHGTALEKEDLKLTLFLTESNVKSRNQSGATRDYIHQNMLRSVNSVWGEPVAPDADGTFSASSRLEILTDWKQEDCRIIAFLTSVPDEATGISRVLQTYSLPLLCSEEKTIPSDSGIREAEESPIRVSIIEGRLMVEGEYEYIRVYDLAGRALNAERIPQGIYMAVIGLPDGGVTTRKIQN